MATAAWIAAGLGGAPLVAVVESADLGNLHDQAWDTDSPVIEGHPLEAGVRECPAWPVY